MSTSRLWLGAAGAFDHRAALAMLAAHAVPGAESVDLDAGTFRRVIAIGGRHHPITLAFSSSGVALTLDAQHDADEITSRVVRWFDLGTDTAPIDRTLGSDPRLAALVARRPGLRLIGYPDEFEAVAATIIGQQVSLAAARTFAGRLLARYGDQIEDLRVFPTAHAIAAVDPDELQATIGLTRARTRTLLAAATRWADGDLLAGQSAEDARRMLLALPGVGPWTADYLLVRALQHPDTFAPGDLVARRALGLDATQAADRAKDWAPFRSYALLHLWVETAYT